MKLVFITLFVLKCWQLSAQCPNSLVIYDLEDIEKFVQEYPDCTELNSLSLQGINATIKGLEQINSVGSVNLTSTNIDTLDLTKAFSVLSAGFTNNPTLKSVNVVFRDSMNSLSVISNPLLSEIEVTGNKFDDFILESDNTDTIKLSVNGESAVKPAINSLLIKGNWKILGVKMQVLDNLQVFDPTDDFNSFMSIQQFMGLSEIKRIYIVQLNTFSCKGILNLNKLEHLAFLYIDSIDFKTVNQYHHQLKDLTFSNCDNLKDLTPWINCSIQSLSVNQCPKLQSLDGVKFETIVGSINLTENESLHHLGSINEISSFDSLSEWNLLFESNPELSWCSYDVICNHINTHPDKVIIINNKDQCETIEDVVAGCLSNTDDGIQYKHVKIYPNPASDYLQVGQYWEKAIIYAFDGSFISSNTISSGTLNLNLMEGVYFLQFETGNIKSEFQKLIITSH